jgi:putative DNA primase/helicase
MHIPFELLEYRQWVLWRKAEVNGRITKVPISPWCGKPASCDRPQSWGTYRHVRYALHRFHCTGIGFVFTDSDPFCGIDLDHCGNLSGTIAPEALALIRRIGSYAELSPSGTGVHILLKAKLEGKGRRVGNIEVYDSGRYFTVTGKHISGTPLEIRSCQDALDQLAAEIFSPAEAIPLEVLSRSLDLSDQELIQRAKYANNGERFSRLWAGDASDYGNDHSRADIALCRMLAFWTGGDSGRIDRLFRQSGLKREKWDRRTGCETYGVLTIKAILNR